MHPMLTIARRAAEEAGHFILRGYRDLDKIQIHEKGRGDFVSAIDQQSEQIIRQILSEKYPTHDILGEEFGEAQSGSTASEYQWVIDPLDGTANFLHGLPQFAVSIACLHHGKPEVGIVYNPVSDDWYTAARGDGAQLNGQRIRVNKQRNPDRAIVATGFPYRAPENMPQQIAYVASVLETFGDLRRIGSAALDLCMVACGRQDAYFEKGIHIWDIAAGVLIAQEAGAIVTDFAGDADMLTNNTVVCANATLHPLLLKAIQKGTI